MKYFNLLTPAFLLLMAAGCADSPVADEPAQDPASAIPNPGYAARASDIVSPVADFPCVDKELNIDINDLQQEMEGFGASDCWLPNVIGQHWLSKRDEISRLLFSQQINGDDPEGIGLSMWRVNLGAGTIELGDLSGINSDNINNRAESYLSPEGLYDWTKCAGQRYFMEQAKNLGCEKFVLFSNSPLVQYTLNGQGRSDNGNNANLKDDCYGPFATYMATVADHFNKEGYNVTHISPVNEPQYKWDGNAQEGSGWKNSEIARLTRELDAALGKISSPTKILIPEAASWEYFYTGSADASAQVVKAFFGEDSPCYVGDLAHVDRVLGGHSYWTFTSWRILRIVREMVHKNCIALGEPVRVWQTEWSMLDACPVELGGNYDNISEFDIAMYMSKIIHQDLINAFCTSWCYWTAMSVERWSQKNRFELIKTTPAGGNYDNDFTREGTVEATPNLWILGNYSRFVRPGYVRVSTDCQTENDFFTTAFRSPDGKTLVVVYNNFDKENGVKVKASLKGVSTVNRIQTFTTSENKKMKRAEFNPEDDIFVDPYSVTTVVYEIEPGDSSVPMLTL